MITEAVRRPLNLISQRNQALLHPCATRQYLDQPAEKLPFPHAIDTLVDQEGPQQAGIEAMPR
jgi:hypothetical protein